MTPARAVGAGGALDARTSRGARAPQVPPSAAPNGLPAGPPQGALPADGPVWRAHLTDGFAGRVVDEFDRPLAGALVVAVAACSMASAGVSGASVSAAGAAPGPARGWFVASTEADGRFTIPVLPTGRYTLFALHIGPPPATSELVVVDGGFLSVPLRLVIRRGVPLL